MIPIMWGGGLYQDIRVCTSDRQCGEGTGGVD